MIHYDHRHGTGKCPSCGRLVNLNRNGQYRRHFSLESDGRRRLCVASLRTPDGVVQLLTVDPTPQERYSHALWLLRSVG